MDGRLSSRTRRLLGVAMCWPLLYVTGFLALPATRLFFVSRGWTLLADGVSAGEALGLVLHALTLLGTALLVLFCFFHLAQTRRVAEEQKLPWALLLVLAAPLSMPVYWWSFVRGDGTPPPTRSPEL